MQDEGGAKKVNPVLERHWEKLVLGVVAALAVVYLGTRFSGPGDAAAKSVDRVVASYQTKKNQANTRSESPKTFSDHEVPPPVAANRAPATTPGNPTEYLPEIITGPPKPKDKFLFPTVTLAIPRPKPDGVELSWTLSEVVPDPKDPTKPIIVPRTTFVWRVERRKKGGEWEETQKALKSEGLKYIDASTDPKTEYEYRLTLGSIDPAYTRVNPSGWTNMKAGPVSAQTLGIWFFDFSNMISDPDADPPKPAQVYVTIRKYDKDAGLVEWKKIQNEGDLLGVIKENGVEVSKHRVPGKNGRPVVVDFKSGARIKKIVTEKIVPYEYEECQVKTDDAGGRKCEKIEKKKGTYKVDELNYTDEDGKPQTFTKIDGPGPNAGYHCELHGGPPPPKELTPEEKLAQRETEATRMLEEADNLWTSEKSADRKKAQGIYEKLLKSYGDLASVKARKADLTERHKKKIE